MKWIIACICLYSSQCGHIFRGILSSSCLLTFNERTTPTWRPRLFKVWRLVCCRLIHSLHAFNLRIHPLKSLSHCSCVYWCSEKIDTLFSGLTKDLMDPNNSMEQTFELIQELKTATEKYFHLKKLFWKVSLLWSQQVVFDLAVIFYNFINPQRIEYKRKLCRDLLML